MNKIVWLAIGIVLLILVIAAVVMGMGNESAGNMSNPDVQNAEQQDVDNSSSNPGTPDPVKESTGDTVGIQLQAIPALARAQTTCFKTATRG